MKFFFLDKEKAGPQAGRVRNAAPINIRRADPQAGSRCIAQENLRQF
jgi:hypothetical protein